MVPIYTHSQLPVHFELGEYDLEEANRVRGVVESLPDIALTCVVIIEPARIYQWALPTTGLDSYNQSH